MSFLDNHTEVILPTINPIESLIGKLSGILFDYLASDGWMHQISLAKASPACTPEQRTALDLLGSEIRLMRIDYNERERRTYRRSELHRQRMHRMVPTDRSWWL